jgi:hypothetical protein
MQNSNSNLNTGRFLRLIAISSVEMLLSIPFSTWVLVQNSQVMVHSQSWADTHYQFSRIVYASINTRSVGAETYALQNFARWIPVFTAFLYFAFFGMQEEAMSGYTSAWEALSRTMGRVARYLTPSTSRFYRDSCWSCCSPSLPSQRNSSQPHINPPQLSKLGTSVASPSEMGWSRDIGYGDKEFGLAEDAKDAEEVFSRSRITVTVERQVV